MITDRIRRMGEGNVFSLSTEGGRGYLPPIQVRTGGGVPQGTYPPGIGQSMEYLILQSVCLLHSHRRYPAKVPTPIQVRMRGRGYPKVPIPSQGTYPPSRSGWGAEGTPRYLPPWHRTAYGVLDMLWSVCLLRSRRRTF